MIMSMSINQHFSPGRLLQFALPSIIMMMFMSLYTIVDGIFISRFIGSNALSSLNIVFPVICIVTAIGTMLATGGNAIISKYLGEGKHREARECLTMFVVVGVAVSIVVLVFTHLFLTPVCYFLGSNDVLLADCEKYLATAISFAPACMLQSLFQSYLVTAEKPHLGLFLTIGAGILNAFLDYFLIAVCRLGMTGAALATGIGQTFSLVVYLIVYAIAPISVQPKKKYLKLEKKMVGKLYSIGIPATLNMALPSVLISSLNAILAAYAESYILVLGIYYKLQTFLYLPANGIIQGMRPLIGYNYGAGEHKRVNQIYKIVFFMCGGIMLFGTIICLAVPGQLMGLFTHTEETIKAGETALRIISAGFIVSAVSVTSSGALEGLGKGVPSLIISLCRYIIFIIPAAYVFSRAFGPVGVWHAFWVAEVITAVVAYITYRKSTSCSA